MITIEVKNIEYAKTMLGNSPKEIQRALKNSINRTVRTVRTAAAKIVRERYTISSSYVKERIKIRTAKVNFLKGTVLSTGSPATLTRFDVKKRAKGPVVVRVLKSSTRKPIRRMFLKSKRGTSAVLPFRRVGKDRYPLTVLRGPSIPSMIGNEKVLNKLVPLAEETLNKRFLHEIDYRLDKLGGK